MGENEDNIEEINEETEEEREAGKNKKLKIPALSAILVELIRLFVFVLITLIITNYMISRQESNSLANNIRALDEQNNQDLVFAQNPGREWEMEELLINTADDLANHFVKTKVIFAFSQDETLLELNSRQNQIYSEIRKIIGVDKFADLKSIKKQEEIARTIKNKVQRLLKSPDTISVYLKEFTIY